MIFNVARDRLDKLLILKNKTKNTSIVFTLAVILLHITEDIPASLSSENYIPGNNEAR